LEFRPVVAFARAAPGAVELAVRIELEDWRGRRAALGGRWRLHCALLVIAQGRGPLQHPDVVMPVHGYVGDLAEDLIAWQWLGPEGIDLEAWHVVGARWRERSRCDNGERNGLDDPHVCSLTDQPRARYHISARGRAGLKPSNR